MHCSPCLGGRRWRCSSTKAFSARRESRRNLSFFKTRVLKTKPKEYLVPHEERNPVWRLRSATLIIPLGRATLLPPKLCASALRWLLFIPAGEAAVSPAQPFTGSMNRPYPLHCAGQGERAAPIPSRRGCPGGKRHGPGGGWQSGASRCRSAL